MSVKFGLDILFLTGNCLIISPYLPGGTISSRTSESRLALPHISSLKYLLITETRLNDYVRHGYVPKLLKVIFIIGSALLKLNPHPHFYNNKQ